jgi:DNA-binding protein YbaB
MLDMIKMMGKAKELKAQMDQMQQNLKTLRVSKTSADGAFTVIITGERRIEDFIFHQEQTETLDFRQVRDTINLALSDVDLQIAAKMQEVSGDLLPGLNLPGLGA